MDVVIQEVKYSDETTENSVANATKRLHFLSELHLHIPDSNVDDSLNMNTETPSSAFSLNSSSS
jgi:hypothetical protein